MEQLKAINFKEISGISYNSATAQKGGVFVCIEGENTDGHNFAKDAEAKGIALVVANRKIEGLGVPQMLVSDTKKALAKLAAHFYEAPSANMNIIGITGTNGKTTVAHLVQKIFEENAKKCGMIGTLGYTLSQNDDYKDAKHTTPQAVELQKTLKTMLDSGVENVAIEVSSHSLDQHRVGEVNFKGAVLTNLTQDHLDYHITMDKYFNSKAELFKRLGDGKWAVINIDDNYAQDFIKKTSGNTKILTYGIKNNADIMAKDISFNENGSSFTLVYNSVEKPITLKMTGLFSIYNTLASLATAIAEGLNIDISIKALEKTQSVRGRFEVVERNPLVIVDYAHTPDGLDNVLAAAKEIVPNGGKLSCVFGCGGDRDATKRPQMGAIAEKWADKIIITSDNPRTEDPQQIITDILTGITSLNTEKIMVEADRKSAIQTAIENANSNDVVVIAGKGHEDYQILATKTIHFDDREEAQKAYKKFFG